MLDVVGLEGPDVLAEFGGNCLQPSVIYQATVIRKDNNTTETYIGLTLFPGVFSHHTRRTTAQVKDVISASKKNS